MVHKTSTPITVVNGCVYLTEASAAHFHQLAGQPPIVGATVDEWRLFEIDPSLRPLFVGDIEQQAKKLIDMLAARCAMHVTVSMTLRHHQPVLKMKTRSCIEST